MSKVNIDEDLDFKQALTELSVILEYTEKEIVDKIPKSFMNFIETNKDNNYEFNVDLNLPLNEQNIKDSTKSLIALVYRSYIATLEEKEEFKLKDKEEFRKEEEEKNKKYNPKNIFKNEDNVSVELSNKDLNSNKSLIVKKENFFEKIILKIKNIFNNLFKSK